MVARILFRAAMVGFVAGALVILALDKLTEPREWRALQKRNW